MKHGIIPNIQRKGKVILDVKGDIAIYIQGMRQDQIDGTANGKVENDLTYIVDIMQGNPILSLTHATSVFNENTTNKEKIQKEIRTKLTTFKHTYCPIKKRYQLFLYIEKHNQLELYSQIYVVGTFEKHKVVDYNYLFMTNISALQAISNDIEKIKKHIGMS